MAGSVTIDWHRPEGGGGIPPDGIWARDARGRRNRGIWLFPLLVFGVMALLALGFWRAETHVDPTRPGRSPGYVLWGGLIIAVLLSGTLFELLLHRARAEEQTRKHLEAIETLNAVSTAISAQLSAGTALDALAAAAQRLLKMDRAGVAMYDPDRRMLEVVAVAGQVPPQFPKRYALAELPASSYALETNTNLFEGDTRNPTRSYGPRVVEVFDARSLILIPLRLESRPIGLLTMSASEPREFTNLDRRICELLGAQASVVLSNQQLYQTMRSALESSQRLLQQRQALSAVAIRSRGTVEDSMAQMVRLIPPVIGAEICGLSLVTGPDAESVVAAMSPPYEELVGASTGPSPLAAQAFAGRKPLTIPQAYKEPRLHRVWQRVRDLGSLLYVPIFRSDGEPLGMLALARRQTGPFTHEQEELAQAFGALISVAIENARLLDQTRSDAAAKAMLLRELNHRVKNNLTGIVALLEANRPPMDEPARQWLDRATGRIRAMAAAHQLFVGGMDRVPLSTLVAQTLAACATARAPSTKVDMDLDEVRDTIGPEQAVALAMVLNELCHNAMIHGLRNGGTLTIRARGGTHLANPAPSGEAPARVRIEVADNGSPPPAAPVSAGAGQAGRGGGQGLELVDGLVQRELAGTFELRAGANGIGTVAVVEFPLVRANDSVT